jgi:membrane-associated phospholipid phosphatase
MPRTLRLALALTTVLASAPLPAQRADSTPPPPRPQPIVQTSDLLYLAGAGLATAAVAHYDEPIANYMQSHGQGSTTLRHLSKTVEEVTLPGAYLIGGGLYLGGRLAGNHRIADLGLHGTEAIFIGSAITGVLKFTTGRARPFLGHDESNSFAFMRGTRDDAYRSFPSGHTVVAFAAASAVTEEASRWRPNSVWVVGPVLYGGATLVGLARMYHDEHWASDVVMGAAIGIFTGRRVVRWHHTHPGNRLDRILLGVSAFGTADGGYIIHYTMPLRL